MSFPGRLITDLYGQPCHGLSTYRLVQDIPRGSSLRVGWTLTMMDIYEHERNVDRGRFEHYDRQPQDWVATIKVEPEKGPLTQWVPQLVNWIAENHDGPWHLIADMEDVNEGYLRFSFADPDLAVMFKMANG